MKAKYAWNQPTIVRRPVLTRIHEMIKAPTSVWEVFWKRSSIRSCFFPLKIRDNTRKYKDRTWARGFRRILSDKDRAPRLRDFFMLNSWDIFVVILFSNLLTPA